MGNMSIDPNAKVGFTPAAKVPALDEVCRRGKPEAKTAERNSGLPVKQEQKVGPKDRYFHVFIPYWYSPLARSW
jgi:hypothetical protein